MLWGVAVLLVASAAEAQTPAPAAEPPPPAATPPAEPAPPKPAPSWFTRPAYTIGVGDGGKWKFKVYGFAELDVFNDSTRTYQEPMGQALIPRNGTQGGNEGRTIMSARNSRFGFNLNAPEIDGFKSSAGMEFDAMGYLGPLGTTTAPPASNNGATVANPAATEGTYAAGTIRLRNAWVKMETNYVDVLAGLQYVLFGWQPYFFPASQQFLPVPGGEVFGRQPQIRLSHTFKTDAVNVDFAVAADRPPQRDSSIPEGAAGLMLKVNKWKAMRGLGFAQPQADGSAIGVSGVVRKFKVDNFSAAPNDTRSDTGYGVSIDALIAVIPAENNDDRSNKLSLTGSFATGSGIGDQMGGMTGGIGYPALPAAGTPPVVPPFIANIDPGIVTYDKAGILHTINWQSYFVGLQYYLPTGRAELSLLYGHGSSDNIKSLATNVNNIITEMTFLDAGLYFDWTPAIRSSIGYNYTTQTRGDDMKPRNQRYTMSWYYFF
jgi:hypothetical protein